MKRAIPIELDKVRNLRYGTNAICQMEDMLGRPISALNNSTGMKEIRIMLYCGLTWEDKSLTLDKVGEAMDEGIENHGITYISEKLSEAIQLAIGDKKK